MKVIQLIAVLLIGQIGWAQNVVMRNDTVEVLHQGQPLKHAWASGINCAHTSTIDLNLDGKKDLFLFEANAEYNEYTGDKILTFLNTGNDYVYAPEYRNYFPPLHGYAMLVDYNCDGKEDIFTHNELFQSITVYRNDSDTELKFTKVVENLTTDISNLPPGFGHQGIIYWNYEDFLSFTDIDSDGDIDILTIDYIGSYIEYNKNMSIENNYGCDSLLFEVKNTCWGKMAEDFGIIMLDTCHPYGNVPNPERLGNWHAPRGTAKGSKHSNTSLLAIDLDGDSDKDLLVGDGITPHLSAYYNGGKKDSSHITSVDTFFPDTDSVNLMIYAMPFYQDVDHDNKRDLLVTPRYDQYQDTNSVWFYKNIGTDASPVFSRQSKAFMQNEMIDVGRKSKPVLFDYNMDGLLDLVVGNLGYFQSFGMNDPLYHSQLALYENTGELQAPEFELVTIDFAGLSQINLDTKGNKRATGLHPTFGDLDGDGDEDMIVGDYKGKLHHFENNPVNGKAVFSLVQTDIIILKQNDAAPQLFDLDGDSLLDLIIGEWRGNIHFYRNTSSGGSLSFELADDSLGNINVKDWALPRGYSAPFFFRDSLGDVKMLSGTNLGFIQLYDSIIVNDTISEQFKLVETKYQEIWEGIFTTIHGGDLNNDNSLDFVIGNQSGGVTLYTSEDSIYIPGVTEYNGQDINWNLYPNPTSGTLTFNLECKCTDKLEYTIIDVLGNTVYRDFGKQNRTMDVGFLQGGIYFLQVANKNRSILITERFIKSGQ